MDIQLPCGWRVHPETGRLANGYDATKENNGSQWGWVGSEPLRHASMDVLSFPEDVFVQ